jgi:hypothetical protein
MFNDAIFEAMLGGRETLKELDQEMKQLRNCKFGK